jgi:glycosyltransferase involved in cell wall biosynthesis
VRVLALSNLYPPDFIGGYELACAQVVDALRERGHDVRVLTAAPRLPAPSPSHVLRRFKLVDEWSEEGMARAPLAFRLDEAESRLVSAHNIHMLLCMLEEFEPDVVYPCCITGLGGLGLLACLGYLKVPWVWQLGDRVPHHLCSTGQTVIPGLAAFFSSRIRGHYIVVSDQLRREIEACRIALAGDVETIPNWIIGERGPVARKYFHGGRLRIMFAGQVARWKGADVLIESIARLRALGFDDFSVDVYGRVHQPDLADLIRGLGLENHIVLKGVVPQATLLSAYREYDVLAFPTHGREPFGLVPLEALARGCVPVMTRKCGVAEWLVHGVHCFKVERDPESFTRVFAAILRGELDLEPIARRGITAAWRDFHLDAILPRIERLLVRAAAQPRNGAGRPAEAYRMARMAEHLASSLLHEAFAA